MLLRFQCDPAERNRRGFGPTTHAVIDQFLPLGWIVAQEPAWPSLPWVLCADPFGHLGRGERP